MTICDLMLFHLGSSNAKHVNDGPDSHPDNAMENCQSDLVPAKSCTLHHPTIATGLLECCSAPFCVVHCQTIIPQNASIFATRLDLGVIVAPSKWFEDKGNGLNWILSQRFSFWNWSTLSQRIMQMLFQRTCDGVMTNACDNLFDSVHI